MSFSAHGCKGIASRLDALFISGLQTNAFAGLTSRPSGFVPRNGGSRQSTRRRPTSLYLPVTQTTRRRTP